MVEAGLVFVEDSKNTTQHRCISVNRSEEHSPGDRSKGVLDVGLHSDCVGVLLMKEPLHVCHCSEASLGTRAELGRMEELLEGVFQDCKAQSADEATKSFTYADGSDTSICFGGRYQGIHSKNVRALGRDCSS